MNKVIFQIGVLAFCVSIVAFGAQHMALIQTVSRSFIIFVGVVVTCVILYTIAAVAVDKARRNKSQGRAKTHGLHNIGTESESQGTASHSS